MGGTIHLPDGTTVRVEQDLIDATPMSIIDLSWRYVDPNGHKHAWRQTNADKRGEPPAGDLPTLVWIVEVPGGEYFDEDGYECYAPEIGHYECRECGERVPNPGIKRNDQQYFIAGLKRAYINDEPATEAQVRALYEKWKGA